MSGSLSLLLAMTFMAVFMVSIAVLLLGPRHQLQKRLHHHLEQMGGDQPMHQVLRRRYVEQLPPWLQKVEQHPLLAGLDLLLLQAGKGNRALELMGICLAIALLSITVLLMLDVGWPLVMVLSLSRCWTNCCWCGVLAC
ncbi:MULTISPECIES: hypothetical protein [unclassified Endozoicomonas]|uniref:hypothetical protein n=1 Tax=unclassified Endozoicomonas TaxID=2644528 RepID=UPI003BB703AA